MEKQILDKLEEIKWAIAKMAGTSDLPEEKWFSKESLDKAAKEFRSLAIKRGEWISEYELNNYFKDVHYGTGKFIRETFEFADFFIQGRSYYYRKSSVAKLAKELKARNVDLGRYMELKQSQEKFKKRVTSALSARAKSEKRKNFSLPDYLKDIVTEGPKPSIETVQEDIERIKKEFADAELSRYVDIYDTHAMVKFDYPFSQYFDSKLKARCKQWCNRFNLANYALTLLTSMK